MAHGFAVMSTSGRFERSMPVRFTLEGLKGKAPPPSVPPSAAGVAFEPDVEPHEDTAARRRIARGGTTRERMAPAYRVSRAADRAAAPGCAARPSTSLRGRRGRALRPGRRAP